MPRRTDIERILIVGSGPIVIGQACEFDYSGTQACKVLCREGYRVSLVNSNPATIMTDPGFADRTYVEPLTPDSVLAVIERERPDVLLPTLGGQTALNVSVALAESGDLERLGVRLIGAGLEAIRRAEDRSGFQRTMQEAGLPIPRAGTARAVAEAVAIGEQIGYPLIVRPSFMLGGGGSGFAHDRASLEDLAARGLALSPVTEILVEESVAGWKEFELEVMRDGRMISGKPISRRRARASSMVRAMPLCGTARPMCCIAALNSSRSSAFLIAGSLAPMSSTP